MAGSIFFPAISTGIFGFPLERCARIMLATTIDYLEEERGINRIVFCLFGQESFYSFKIELTRIKAQRRSK